MKSPSACNPRTRLIPFRWAAGFALAPLTLLGAGEATPGRTMGSVDVLLILGAGLTGGVVMWLVNRAKAKDLARQADSRIKQMTALIEHAGCLLWEADVEMKPNDWHWRMTLHNSAFCRKLFRGQPPTPGVDLWKQFQLEDREVMNRRARSAMEGGQPSYEQEFRAVRDGQVYWLHENVSITPVGAGCFRLVGLVTDLTAQREAEAARHQSEQTMERILAHAQCMLWRATVTEEGGVFKWPHFDAPRSRLSEMLFGTTRVFSAERGFWDELAMPEQRKMDEHSSRAIRSGAPGYEQQFRTITPDGRTFWLHERVSITCVGERQWSLVGVVTDITAQVEAEEAHRRTETALAHLLERADCLLWEAKVELRPTEVLWEISCYNTGFTRRIFGLVPPPTQVGLWYRFEVPERLDMDRRAREALENGRPGYEQQFRLVREDGTFWIHERVTITPTGPNKFSLVGLATDITAQREAQQALRANEERLRNLIDGAECMVWDATVRKRADDTLEWDQYIPPSALYRRIFGEPDADGPRLSWERLTIPEFPEMVARTLAALNARAPGYTQEFHVVQPEGDLWLRESATIDALDDDRFRMTGVITDITAQRRAEEAQQKSEVRLTALLEQADCMIWQGDCRRHGSDDFSWKIFTPRSQLYRRLFGRDPDGECHFAWNEVVPEFPEMRTRARHALTHGLPGYEQVFRCQHPAGEIWLNEKVSIRQSGPNHWELIGIITDITTQRRSEEARKASEQRLSELLSRADCLLWEATVDMLSTGWKWNSNIQPSLFYRRLTGEQLPKPTEPMWPVDRVPERLEMDRHCREAILTGRSGYEQVFHFVKDDGEHVWISENVTIQRLDHDRYWLVGVAVDISPQRRAEEALMVEKERLAVTLRAMSESVITTDIAGVIQFMNPAAAALTERALAGCIGRQVQEICVLENSRTGTPTSLPIVRVAQGDIVADLPAHTRLVTFSGKRRVIEGCCAPIHAADSRVTGVVIVMRDVTEQERLEQELVRATRLESVGVLAGGIAHDFNNILTAVMGNLTLAQLDIPSDSPAGASLRSAEKAALRARDLTQQLLTFAKGGEPVRAAVQLDTIIREMTSFALHGSKVRPHYDLAPDLWPADADKGQIGRVVQNLVINAVQAMPHGGTLQIMVRNDPQDGMSQPGLSAGDYIQIAISDTGEGIKAEHLARIFDPYFTTKQTGTGLGLAAVYSIVKKHRGHIEVDSQPGQGSTFRIWLPALRERPAGPDSRKPWADGKAARMKGRVLFMDDEQSIREMAVALLQRLGLAVDCAVDGAEAVEKYRTAFAARSPYDLVIMDLTVPGGMGGLAALGKLREIDPAVKAIVSSGYSSDPVLANFRTHGFVAMVAKPYEVHEISRVLREVLPGV